MRRISNLGILRVKQFIERKDFMEHRIGIEMLEDFRQKLVFDEKSEATIEKYMRDLKTYVEHIGNEGSVTKEQVLLYKKKLMEEYAVSSVNSILAALNHFFKEMGWYDCVVRSIKIQRKSFRVQDKELTQKEYYRLLEEAKKRKKMRLYYLMQTICGTGIRVSELQFITVEALEKKQTTVSLKGKVRTVIIPSKLCKLLKRYVKEKKITSGPVFVTKNGKPLDRSNICHEMKALSKETGICKSKIFPHNLRHLFACVYYEAVKDLAHLADILGHSNINTTRIYTQISSVVQSRQMDRLKLVL